MPASHGPVARPLVGKTRLAVVTDRELKRRANDNPGGERETGTWFEWLIIRQSDGDTVIYVANSLFGSEQPIDRESVWSQRIEVEERFSKVAAGYRELPATMREPLVLATVTEANILKLRPGATRDDVLREFSQNSQSLFEQTTRAYRDGSQRYPVAAYATAGVTMPNYSHIRHFSWFYTEEMGLVEECRDRRVCVVDAGAGFGHWIRTCARLLPAETLARVRFIGVDLSMDDLRFAMEASSPENLPDLRVLWQCADIRSSAFVESLLDWNDGRLVALIVLNHVLEHCTESEPPEVYIQSLLRCARQVAITLPLHDCLEGSLSAHVKTFTPGSLAELGRQVAGSRSDIEVDDTKVGGGLLVFRKVGYSM
jgi:hypothetical protein